MEERIIGLKDEKRKKLDKTNTYDDALGDFLHNLNILSNFNKVLPKFVDAYYKERSEILKTRMKSLDKGGRNELLSIINLIKKLIEGSRRKPIIIKNEKVGEFLYQQAEVVVFESRFRMFISEMSLTYLITCFEEFLRNTLEITFKRCPNILKSSKKQMTYEELLEYKEIDDIKKSIIEKEIDLVMYRGIDGINTYLKTQFDVDLSVTDNWHLFKERFYRRNIVIHNDCYPNKVYRKKTNYRGKHKRLSISKQYLSGSHKLFEEFSKKINRHFKEKFL